MGKTDHVIREGTDSVAEEECSEHTDCPSMDMILLQWDIQIYRKRKD